MMILPEILGDEGVRRQSALVLTYHAGTLRVAVEGRAGHRFAAELVVVGSKPGRKEKRKVTYL